MVAPHASAGLRRPAGRVERPKSSTHGASGRVEDAVAHAHVSALEFAKGWAEARLARMGLSVGSFSSVSGGNTSITLAIETTDLAVVDGSRFFLKIPQHQQPELIRAMHVDFVALQEWHSLLAAQRIGSSGLRVLAPEPVSIDEESGCYLMRGCRGTPANELLNSKKHSFVREADSVVEALSAALHAYYSTYSRAHGDLGLHNLVVGEGQMCLLDPGPSPAHPSRVEMLPGSDDLLAFDLANWLFVVVYKRVRMTFRSPIIRWRELVHSCILIRGLMNEAETRDLDDVRAAVMAHLSVRRRRALAERRLHVVNDVVGLPALWQARRILRTLTQ